MPSCSDADETKTNDVDAGRSSPPTPPKGRKLGNSNFRSTWHEEEKRASWGPAHYLFHFFGIDPLPPGFTAPIHGPTDKVPYISSWDLHRWILPRILAPFALHYSLYRFCDITLHPAAAFALYSIWFKVFGVMTIRMLRDLSTASGFLDAKTPRDGVPDEAVNKVMLSLISTSTYRPMLCTILAYDRNAHPLPSLPWIVGYMMLYPIVLDFYFYWYHRAMHEVDWLWRFHKTHHLTRHPNPGLTLFADEVQETFDIVGIPLLAYLTLRSFTTFTFYDWLFCAWYVTFVELAGHSGLRVNATSPASFLLPPMGLEIVPEDHDLHHRKGWKASGGNYCKQSRVWDYVFGTTMERQECIPANLDKTAKLKVPW